MSKNKGIDESISEFKPHARGGMFTTKTRKRLMGISGRTGRGRPKNRFWYDVRNSVKQALLDLKLFIDVADDRNINQVINSNNILPLLQVLFWDPIVDQSDPNLERAKIAQWFIKAGFDYLIDMIPIDRSIPSTIQKAITEAIEMSNFLVDSFPNQKRN